MKRIFTLLCLMGLVVSLTACVSGTSGEVPPVQKSTAAGVEAIPAGSTAVTLTIGDKVLDGILDDSGPARSLLSQLPLTVTLQDSGNDFCGDKIHVAYTEEDITSGYKNGDLAFWPAADNFVLFKNGEEHSDKTSGLVHLGRVTSSQKMLDSLSGTLTVNIAKKEPAPAVGEGKEQMRIKITAGNHTMYAELEDNEAARAWAAQMPLTLPMENLYDREMCYRYGAGTLPTEHLRSDNYEVGDIVYWPPRGSLVILYRQNGERFERQQIGHISEDVGFFENAGNTEVTFEQVR